MPGCHFVRNTGNLYAVLLPELAAFRIGSRWLALEARAAAAFRIGPAGGRRRVADPPAGRGILHPPPGEAPGFRGRSRARGYN